MSNLTPSFLYQKGKKERRKEEERVTESALIQCFKGPASGVRTTPAISPSNLLLITLLSFLAYEENKIKCYNNMSAITVRVKELTAAPIWATSYLRQTDRQIDK